MRSSTLIPSSFPFSHSTGDMRGLRKRFTLGLALIMCTLTSHCSRSAPSVTPVSAAARGDAQRGLRRIVEIVRHVEENRSRHSAQTKSTRAAQVQTSPMEAKDLHTLKTDRRDPAAVIHAIDPKKKEQFLKILTGPLSFSPNCRKEVYKLHHTRDCTIPAYYKRCARLLRGLSGKPECTEG